MRIICKKSEVRFQKSEVGSPQKTGGWACRNRICSCSWHWF